MAIVLSVFRQLINSSDMTLHTPRRLLKIYALKASFGVFLLLGLFSALLYVLWIIGLIGMIFVTSIIFLLSLGVLAFGYFNKNFIAARYFWKIRNPKVRARLRPTAP